MQNNRLKKILLAIGVFSVSAGLAAYAVLQTPKTPDKIATLGPNINPKDIPWPHKGHTKQFETAQPIPDSGSSDAAAVEAALQKPTDLRQTLSDLAWGRNRAGAKGPKATADSSPAAKDVGGKKTREIANKGDGEQVQLSLEQIKMLQAQTEHCAKNWKTDPGCPNFRSPNR